MSYAGIAVNSAVNQLYHYSIPEKLQNRVMRGSLVRVGFGTAMQPGIVVELRDVLPSDLPEDVIIKPIIQLLHPESVMTEEHIELGMWMSEAYLTSPGACLWLMLPPGLTGRSTRMVHLLDVSAEGKNKTQQKILDALREKSPQKVSALKKVAGIKSIDSVIRTLAKEGSVERESVLSPASVSQKTVRTVIRTMPEDEIIDILAKLERAPRQIIAFDYIAKFDYPVDVSDVYDAVDAKSADINALERKGFVQIGRRISYRDSLEDRDFVPSQSLDLTPGQDAVWQVIRESLQKDNPTLALPEFKEGTQMLADNPPLDSGEVARQRRRGFLLHGVTGSGKTEIYLHAISEVLSQGRQAIFLVPEIALTPQTIRRVAERFPEQVAVVHGSLSHGERFDTWRRAREGEIGVIVGTRSALFTPLPDVGLIILDEEHDHSYKHAPTFNPPYYHAREVAEKLVEFNEATLILGSATPDLETYYRTQKGELAYVHMPERIMGHRQRVEKQAKQRGVELAYQAVEGDAMTIGLPPVTVVDMREELKMGNRSMFSRDMRLAIQAVIEREEQAILFLNRRGQASYVFCRDCGYVLNCERCDTPMTYHRHGDLMRCHHCSHQQASSEICPECNSDRIRFFGAGTQQVEQALRKEFPRAKTLRWDRDTANKPEHHEAILAKFAAGEANVMIGTQMIAKGLDLPLVTLVGVISADPGLAMPDFRAQERAFQTLTQVAGRAGRSIRGGQVVIQTYQPEHPSIRMAAGHDYEQFYEMEINARRELGYPPYRRLGRILVQNTHPIEAQRQIEAATEQVQHIIEKYDLRDSHLIGPAPCFFSRLDRHYRWQLLIRSSDPTRILQHVQQRNGWYIDIDPVDIL